MFFINLYGPYPPQATIVNLQSKLQFAKRGLERLSLVLVLVGIAGLENWGPALDPSTAIFSILLSIIALMASVVLRSVYRELDPISTELSLNAQWMLPSASADVRAYWTQMQTIRPMTRGEYYSLAGHHTARVIRTKLAQFLMPAN